MERHEARNLALLPFCYFLCPACDCFARSNKSFIFGHTNKRNHFVLTIYFAAPIYLLEGASYRSFYLDVVYCHWRTILSCLLFFFYHLPSHGRPLHPCQHSDHTNICTLHLVSACTNTPFYHAFIFHSFSWHCFILLLILANLLISYAFTPNSNGLTHVFTFFFYLYIALTFRDVT